MSDDLNTPPFHYGENESDNEVSAILAAAIKIAAENEMATASNPNDFIPDLPNSPYEHFMIDKVLDWEEQNSKDLASFANGIMCQYYENPAGTHWAECSPEEQFIVPTSTSFSSFASSSSSSSSSAFSSSFVPAIFQQNSSGDACAPVRLYSLNASDGRSNNTCGETITFTVAKKEETKEVKKEEEEEEEVSAAVGEEMVMEESKEERKEMKEEVEEEEEKVRQQMEYEELKALGQPIFSPINIADYLGATNDYRNYRFDDISPFNEDPLDLSFGKKQMNTSEFEGKQPARNEIGERNYCR